MHSPHPTTCPSPRMTSDMSTPKYTASYHPHSTAHPPQATQISDPSPPRTSHVQETYVPRHATQQSKATQEPKCKQTKLCTQASLQCPGKQALTLSTLILPAHAHSEEPSQPEVTRPPTLLSPMASLTAAEWSQGDCGALGIRSSCEPLCQGPGGKGTRSSAPAIPGGLCGQWQDPGAPRS